MKVLVTLWYVYGRMESLEVERIKTTGNFTYRSITNPSRYLQSVECLHRSFSRHMRARRVGTSHNAAVSDGESVPRTSRGNIWSY